MLNHTDVVVEWKNRRNTILASLDRSSLSTCKHAVNVFLL